MRQTLKERNTIQFTSLIPSPPLRAELDAAYNRVMDSGHYILGNEVSDLRKEFIDYLGGGLYGVTLNSGFDGIQLTLRALGIGKGDHVVVPSNAPLPVWMGVSITGATPIPAEPDIWTYNITAKSAIEAVTPQTRAIMVVYLYGRPIEELLEIRRYCWANQLYLIEDCSQAHGAHLEGFKLGTWGNAAVFSFYPTKNMGGYGDGGIVVTPDSEVNEKIAIMRQYGSGLGIGVNSRMDSLQAAFLRVRLKFLDEVNAWRVRGASQYLEELRNISGLSLPDPHPGHVWHQFVIRHQARDVLESYLDRKGVETMIHYASSPHQMPFYYQEGVSLPVAEVLSNTVLSLPIASVSEDDIKYICDLIRKF